MADSVYYHLERMLPQLDDLERRGLFSRDEIREIVRRRRDFEFRLARRSRLKEDYLRYVEYETQLESLRKLRKKALARQLRASHKRWQKSLCDRASAMRIMLIYQRAVTKFKGDLQLWLRYLEYCRSQSTRRMQKVLTRALQLHSHVPGLWIYAAGWEFQHNMNVTAARVLMQRGLRMCCHSENLWLEYFRMELLYSQCCQKVIDSEAVTTEGQEIGVNGDNGNLNTDVNNARDVLIKTNEMVTSEGKCMESHNAFFCKLARVIYQNAISVIPSSFMFRQRIIEVLEQFDFEDAHILEEEILNRLLKDFPREESCWDWHAKRFFKRAMKSDQLNLTAGTKAAIEVYEEALTVVPSVCMFELYAKFLQDLLQSDGCEALTGLYSSESNKYCIHELSKTLMSVYGRAEENIVASSALVEGHVSFLLRLGKLDTAMELADKFCNSDFKHCGKTWTLKISLAIRQLGRSKEDLQSIFSLFKQSLKLISIAEAGIIWHMALECFAGEEAYYDELLDAVISSLGGYHGGQTGAEIACSVIDGFLYNQSIAQARRAYKRLLSLPGPSIFFYRHCISIESRIASIGCIEALQHLRFLFKSALEIYGQDSELWLQYYSLELKAGNSEGAGTVYWRARKTLHDPSIFIENYQQVVA